MVDTNKARKLITSSLRALKAKNPNPLVDDYAADIINVTCKYFLENGYEVKSGPQHLAMSFFTENFMNLEDDVVDFISSAQDEYPNILTATNIKQLTQSVCLNLGWNGMYAFVLDYFSKKGPSNPLMKSSTTAALKTILSQLQSLRKRYDDTFSHFCFDNFVSRIKVQAELPKMRDEFRTIASKLQGINTYSLNGPDEDIYFEIQGLYQDLKEDLF